MGEFTPGPWAIDYPSIYAVGKGVRVGRVAAVSIAYKDTATYEANARLIAAAPELYETGVHALRELDCLAACIYHDDQRAEVQAFADKFRAALAKASAPNPMQEKGNE